MEEQSSIINICTLLGKLDISPDITKDLLSLLFVRPTTKSTPSTPKYALVFTNNITDEGSAIGDNCMLVNNPNLFPHHFSIPLTEEQYQCLKPFTHSERRVYIKAAEATHPTHSLDETIDIQSSRNTTLSRSLSSVGRFRHLLQIKETTLTTFQTKALLHTDCKGPIVSNEDVYYLFSVTKEHERELMKMIFDSPAFGKLLSISESEHKALSAFTPQTHYYTVFLLDTNMRLNTKAERLRTLSKELSEKFQKAKILGPYLIKISILLLVTCDDFLCKPIKSFVSGRNLKWAEIQQSEFNSLSKSHSLPKHIR